MMKITAVRNQSYSGAKYSLGRVVVFLKNTTVYLGMGEGNSPLRLLTDTDTNWIEPTLLNGWETYDETIAYRIDSLGILHVKGTARYGALNNPIFQLPDSIVIPRNISLVVLMREGHGRLDINTNGYVTPRGTEEEEYDDDGNATGEIVEVAYLSLECGVIL